MLQFRWAARTHVGRVRTNNEDSGFAGPYLIMVADGVGGSAAGEVASASVTYVVSASSMVAGGANPAQVLEGALATSFAHLQQGVLDDPSRSGMATTVTAVLTDGARFAIAHIGDSRGYLLRDHSLRRITRDHTLVQMLVDEHRISPEEARVHPNRSVVVKSLDASHRPDPDFDWMQVEPGDRLLLCSDGLSDLVLDDRIAQLLDVEDLDAALSSLIDEALAAGGRDNITCVAGDVVDADPVAGGGVLVGAVRDVGNLIDAAAVKSTQSV